MPSTVLGVGDTTVNKTDKVSVLTELIVLCKEKRELFRLVTCHEGNKWRMAVERDCRV